MWVGTDVRVRLRNISVVVAGVLAIYPTYALIRNVADGRGWAAAWLALGLTGTLGVGYAFRQATGATWRYLGLCMATAGAIGSTLFVLQAIQTLHQPLTHVLPLLSSAP
jgi:hypothetical protein